MNEKNSIFQIVLLAFLVIAIVAGVFIFSMQKSDQKYKGAVVEIWGVLPEEIVSTYLKQIKDVNGSEVNATYREIESEIFESTLVEALASGVGPDAVIMKDDLLIKQDNKLFNISYDSYPQKNYKETFIEAGDVLLSDAGIKGIPFIIDPMVMYWNRNTLNSAGISFPPRYWDEFLKMVPILVKSDSSFNISKAAVALGEFRNIKNAKEILTTMILQAGNPVIVRGGKNGDDAPFSVLLNENLGFAVAPADAALTYFTQFSNPSKTLYTWNRALPPSDDMFLVGSLAFYFGYASEYSSLRQRNPNLNFDVSVLPQSKNSDAKFTHGDLHFIGLMKSSKNIIGAYTVAQILTNSENMKLLIDIANLPPVRRDLLVEQNSNSAKQNFNLSALIAKPFIDPDSTKTTKIFGDMVESFTSGRSTMSESIERASSELEKLIK